MKCFSKKFCLIFSITFLKISVCVEKKSIEIVSHHTRVLAEPYVETNLTETTSTVGPIDVQQNSTGATNDIPSDVKEESDARSSLGETTLQNMTESNGNQINVTRDESDDQSSNQKVDEVYDSTTVQTQVSSTLPDNVTIIEAPLNLETTLDEDPINIADGNDTNSVRRGLADTDSNKNTFKIMNLKGNNGKFTPLKLIDNRRNIDELNARNSIQLFPKYNTDDSSETQIQTKNLSTIDKTSKCISPNYKDIKANWFKNYYDKYYFKYYNQYLEKIKKDISDVETLKSRVVHRK